MSSRKSEEKVYKFVEAMLSLVRTVRRTPPNLMHYTDVQTYNLYTQLNTEATALMPKLVGCLLGAVTHVVSYSMLLMHKSTTSKTM